MWCSHSPATDESISTIRDGAIHQPKRNKERIKQTHHPEKVAGDGYIEKPVTPGH